MPQLHREFNGLANRFLHSRRGQSRVGGILNRRRLASLPISELSRPFDEPPCILLAFPAPTVSPTGLGVAQSGPLDFPRESDGTPSSLIGAGCRFVRLGCFFSCTRLVPVPCFAFCCYILCLCCTASIYWFENAIRTYEVLVPEQDRP